MKRRRELWPALVSIVFYVTLLGVFLHWLWMKCCGMRNTLGVDENVHGELMVLISANRRIGAGLELLLAVEEGEGLKAHSAGASH